MSDLRDAALRYAAAGISVFPLPPNQKHPPRVHWKDNQKKAWTERDVMTWWSENPDDNIAIATGKLSGISVLDIDGPDGVAALKEAGVSPPTTYTVKTPKGWHLYYAYTEALSQTQGILDHIDIRNDGGYVVAPPSIVDGKPYVLKQDHAYAEWEVVPEALWLRRNGPSPDAPLTTDQPRWVAAALLNGVEQPGRNQMATRLAGYFRSMNLPQDVALASLKQFADACKPPLGYDELRTTLASVWRYERTTPVTYQGNILEPPLLDASTGRSRRFHWPDRGLSVFLERLRETQDGVHAWITIATVAHGDIYGPVRINLLSSSQRTQLRRELKDREEEDWQSVINHVAKLTIASLRSSSPLIDLSKHVPQAKTPWLAYPFIRHKQPTVWFGDGGTGKSTLALDICVSLALGVSLIPGVRIDAPCNSIYLDWESDEDDLSLYLQALLRAANAKLGSHAVLYRHFDGPLTDHLDEIQHDVIEHDIQFGVTDSIVPAAGADVKEADAATAYFNSMRSLGIASLAITHVPVENMDRPYGSRFYWNLARSVWLVQKSEDGATLGLYNRKSRWGMQAPVGLQPTFEEEDDTISTVSYTSARVQDDPVLFDKLPKIEKIVYVLRTGWMQVSEVATETGIPDTQVRAYLNRDRGKRFVKEPGGNRWGNLDDSAKHVSKQVMGGPKQLSPEGREVVIEQESAQIKGVTEEEPW